MTDGAIPCLEALKVAVLIGARIGARSIMWAVTS
jgi:hypothetical protein